MLKIKLDKKGLKEHFRYCWWQYLIAVCFSLFFLGFIYLQTEYRVPENKRIDIYIQSNGADKEKILKQLRMLKVDFKTPIESIDLKVIPLLTDNDYAQAMQLFAYIMAGEGDIYIMSEERYNSLAAQGAFVNLEKYIDILSNIINKDSLNDTRVSTFDGENYSKPTLYGISCKNLKIDGLDEKQTDNLVACISINNNNDLNVVPYFLSLIKNFAR